MYSFLKAFLVLMNLLSLSQFYAPEFSFYGKVYSTQGQAALIAVTVV